MSEQKNLKESVLGAKCDKTTPSWSTACDGLLQGEVLSEVEWAWLGQWVGDALKYEHGRFRMFRYCEDKTEAAQKAQWESLEAELHQVLEARFNKATTDASSILKLDSRGIKLKVTNLDHHTPFGSPTLYDYRLLLSWPAAGPTIKSADVGGVVLPAVASLALNSTCQVSVPPGLKAGGQFLASTLDGRQATVTVPLGISAGQALQYTAWEAGDRVQAKRADGAKYYPAMIRAVNEARQGPSEVTYQVDYDDGSKGECVPVICVPIERLVVMGADGLTCPRQTQKWVDGQWQQEVLQEGPQGGCCLIS
jgi:hypothetical protein